MVIFLAQAASVPTGSFAVATLTPLDSTVLILGGVFATIFHFVRHANKREATLVMWGWDITAVASIIYLLLLMIECFVGPRYGLDAVSRANPVLITWSFAYCIASQASGIRNSLRKNGSAGAKPTD